jgi:hypothetical protein
VGLINQVNDKNKIMKRRDGLVSVDGNDVTANGAPIRGDQEGDWLHKFIPTKF